MGDLRLKVRNKIYTSGNHIVDTKNSNNSIVVFLGKMSSEKLKGYIDNFLEDTLKSQIPGNKISFVQIEENCSKEMPEKLAEAIKSIEFNINKTNELYISFVTIMDDDIYKTEQTIDVSEIEKMKVSLLGGYAVDISYDFYGIFVSTANYQNRQNARRMIVNFLDKENGGVNVRKRVYHQACPGDDYYRSAKSITFMTLVSLIGKVNPYTVLDSEVNGNSYTWTTFALFEKNLAALVIYEMVNKLLENQVNGTEIVSMETISQKIKEALDAEEKKMKKIASVNDVDYIPITVRMVERQLSFGEKFSNVFKRDKLSPTEIRRENEEESINDLLKQQQIVIEKYVDENITDQFIDKLIKSLINQCTVMESINNNQNEALIYKCLLSVKEELLVRDKNVVYQLDYYERRYAEMILNAEAKILDKIISYFNANINNYVESVQKHWNDMNMEVSKMINDFVAFQNYFEGISELISDKTVRLLSSYDDILEMIDVHSVIKTINSKPEIYSSVLSSYYDNVQAAGEIAQRFGNRNIVPDLSNVSYYLYSALEIDCPGKLQLVSDDYWFRDHEIAILFTAKNKISDCDNLPFQA